MPRVGNEDGSPGNEVRVLSSVTVTGSRTAAAGAGTQSITGVGFKANVVLAIAARTDVTGSGSSVGHRGTNAVNSGVRQYTTGNAGLSFSYSIYVDSLLGVNEMRATITPTNDGADLVWEKVGAGVDVDFSLLFLR